MTGWLPEMTETTYVLLVLGGLMSASVLVDTIARRTCLPRISLLVLVGVGYAVIQQLVLGQPHSPPLGELGEPLINLALVMVAFLLGGQLTMDRLRSIGPTILALSLTVAVVGAVTVGLGLTLLGHSLAIAISLAAISVATDPAAVSEAVEDADADQDSPRTRAILGSVAIDDAWGIIIFGLALAGLGWASSGNGGEALVHAGWELGGAILLGAAIGLPAAWLTGRLRPGKPTQGEALALIFLTAGFSSYLGVSPLLAAMTSGFLIVNLSPHHTRSFTEIEGIEWPFLVFFFVLSGASIDLSYIGVATGLIVAYIVLRMVGRYLGGYLGVRALREGNGLPRNFGLAMTPQAGVAMGMALLATEQFPEQGNLIVATVVTSTILFELVGPLLVYRVLRR
ncbi:MAG: cation:proton antiporter [Pseudomonadota bacterium]